MVTLQPATPSDIELLRDIDDDAAELYAEAGLNLNFGQDHPFVLAETACWRHAAALGHVFLARRTDMPDAGPVGFAAIELVDGEPYLEQLSVRVAHMRQGVGGALLRHACDWARGRNAGALWLTTYAHLPWNAPYYLRAGFEAVDDGDCGPGLRAILEDQRRQLPVPQQRIAMRKQFSVLRADRGA